MHDYKKRLDTMKIKMEENSIDIAILQFYVDIYYFSGSNQLSTLIIPLKSNPVFFVQVGLDIAREESWIEDIRRMDGMGSLRELFADRNIGAVTIGINEDTVPVPLYKKYLESFPQANFVNISPIIQDIRLIKTDYEVSLIEKSAEVSLQAHKKVPEVLIEGKTELALSSEIEYVLRKNGHVGCMFSRRGGYAMHSGVIGPSGPNLGVISGSGAITNTGKGLNSAMPIGASLRKINHGDMVEIDIGVNIEGYHSDEARMYVLGKADERQKRAFDAVYSAYQAALKIIAPGVKGKEVYFAARRAIEKAGYLEYFAGFSRYPRYNFLGHGIGLEINESPLINSHDETIFKKNMTIAIEPKVIAPHWGVTFEDTILVTEKGCRLLTKSQRDLIVV